MADHNDLTSALSPGRGYHDLGGLEAGPVDAAVTQPRPWEKLSVVLSNALGLGGTKTLRVDEQRRTREEFGAQLYNELGYFEKGIEAMRRLLVEKGVLTDAEIEARMAAIGAEIAENGR